MFLESAELIRFLCAFLTGALISQSGSLTQISTSNTLAGPATLGFTGIAVLGVMLASGSTYLALIYFFIFVIAIFLYFKKTMMKKTSANNNQILLLGLCFNLFIGAIFSLIQFLFVGLGIEFPLMIWFGSFKQIDWAHFSVFLFLSSFLISIVFIKAKSLSLLIIGRHIAESYKIEFVKLKKEALFLSLIITGVVVCFFGVFSFLGLIFPHILRRFEYFKSDAMRELTIGSILSGLIILCLDMLCYYFPIQGVELPVGMISSVLGSILLMFLLIKKSFHL